ncbi:MAG: hypothetical protein U0840_22615 [Gemmataceae bacterium]
MGSLSRATQQRRPRYQRRLPRLNHATVWSSRGSGIKRSRIPKPDSRRCPPRRGWQQHLDEAASSSNSTIPVSSGQPGSTVHIGADGTSQLTIDGNNLVRDPSSVPVTNKAAILRKVGTGTVVFDDANSYVGETYVDQGVLKIRNAGALGPIINEVQTINIVGPGGFFTLTFNGSTTSSLPAAATATDIQNALNALPSMTTPGWSVVVSPGDPVITSGGDAFAGATGLITSVPAPPSPRPRCRRAACLRAPRSTAAARWRSKTTSPSPTSC